MNTINTSGQRIVSSRVIILVALVIFIAIMPIASAQYLTITTPDSPIDLNAINYTIATSELNISNTHSESLDASANTTTLLDINDTLFIDCMLTINATLLSNNTDALNISNITTHYSTTFNVTDATPSLQYSQQISPSLADGLHRMILNCTTTLFELNTTTLIITNYIMVPSNLSDTNSSSNNSGNFSIIETNTTTITQTNTTQVINSGTQKNVIVDTAMPIITIITPLTQSINSSSLQNVTQNTNSSLYLLPFNFTLTEGSDSICQLTLSPIPPVNGSLQIVSFSIPLDASSPELSSGLKTTTISTSFNVTAINYSYILTCTDLFNRTQSANNTFSVTPLFSPTSPEVQPFLSITMTKSAYNLGELAYYDIFAINNSNVSITICPVAQGWVQCYATPEFKNDTFPKHYAMPYTNKTGQYLVETVMRYKNTTLHANTTFEVVNSISATITPHNTHAVAGNLVTFNATANGGIAPYTYKWTLYDGQTFSGSGAYKNFTSSGTYQINLTVNDSAGNSYTTITSIKIRELYQLKIITYDKKTGSRARDVLVRIDDAVNKTTNPDGEVVFSLVQGKYDIYASKGDYGGFLSNVLVDKNITVSMNLSIEDYFPPKITLLTSTGATFTKDTIKLKFKAEDMSEMYCALYTAKLEDHWFTLKDAGPNLKSNIEYTFDITNLDYGSYKWKIECRDESNNSAYSDDYNFTISSIDLQAVAQKTATSSDDLNAALDRIDALSVQEAEVAQILGIKNELKDILEKVNNLDRDIHNLAFRRDLNENGKLLLQKNYTDTIEYLKYHTPINVEVKETKTFVKYVRDPELKIILDEYRSLKNLNIKENLFFESTKTTQSKAIISTKARVVVLSYLNGEKKEITLITKDIRVAKIEDQQLFAKSTSITFVEHIPKTVIPTIKSVTVLNKEYTVLKEDPLLEFPGSTTTISYSIASAINLDTIQQIDTVIIDKNVQSTNRFTGLAITDFKLIQESLNGKVLLAIVIFILILVYVIISFDIASRIKNFFGMFFYKKKTSYIRVLINDSSDYLHEGDSAKAALIYHEIKLTYESSPPPIQRKVYEECYELCNKIDISYFYELSATIQALAKTNHIQESIDQYETLEKTYVKIDDRYKKDLTERLRSISAQVSALQQFTTGPCKIDDV
ncbi:MAG: PKD domain-containing protein [Candidatus Woesearchaeota archaeon]